MKNVVKDTKKVASIAIVVMTALFCVLITGCDEGMNMAGDVLTDPKPPGDTNLVTNGEVKKPDTDPTDPVKPDPVETTPAKVVEFGYYADKNFTEPLAGDVMTGTVVYTKILFSKAVSVVIADDSSARPKMFYPVSEWGEVIYTQYRIKPRSADLQNGEAKMWRGTDDIVVCRARAPRMRIGLITTFRVRVGSRIFKDNELLITTRPISSFFSDGAHPAPAGEPGDFIGQVRVPDGARSTRATRPIAGVTVSIVSGPRTGESVVTDQGGYYHFREVEGDDLHLLVEMEHFEPKEAIVHRSRPTTLPDRTPIPYQDDAQNTPGTILIGMRWPDEVRFILEEVYLVPDLLFMVGTRDEASGGSTASYHPGLVKTYSAHFNTGSVAHELAHAHQHAVVYPDGIVGRWGYVGDLGWKDTPEGKAYITAMNRDLEEGNTIDLDPSPTHGVGVPFENAAVICSYYWTVDAVIGGEGLKVKAPHRYRWCQEWLNKQYD